MPDKLFTDYIENSLVILCISSGNWWGDNGCLNRDRYLGNFKRWHLKGGRKGGCGEGKKCGGYRVFGAVVCVRE
jgi:hypothetical protein